MGCASSLPCASGPAAKDRKHPGVPNPQPGPDSRMGGGGTGTSTLTRAVVGIEPNDRVFVDASVTTKVVANTVQLANQKEAARTRRKKEACAARAAQAAATGSDVNPNEDDDDSDSHSEASSRHHDHDEWDNPELSTDANLSSNPSSNQSSRASSAASVQRPQAAPRQHYRAVSATSAPPTVNTNPAPVDRAPSAHRVPSALRGPPSRARDDASTMAPPIAVARVPSVAQVPPQSTARAIAGSRASGGRSSKPGSRVRRLSEQYQDQQYQHQQHARRQVDSIDLEVQGFSQVVTYDTTPEAVDDGAMSSVEQGSGDTAGAEDGARGFVPPRILSPFAGMRLQRGNLPAPKPRKASSMSGSPLSGSPGSYRPSTAEGAMSFHAAAEDTFVPEQIILSPDPRRRASLPPVQHPAVTRHMVAGSPATYGSDEFMPASHSEDAIAAASVQAPQSRASAGNDETLNRMFGLSAVPYSAHHTTENMYGNVNVHHAHVSDVMGGSEHFPIPGKKAQERRKELILSRDDTSLLTYSQLKQRVRMLRGDGMDGGVSSDDDADTVDPDRVQRYMSMAPAAPPSPRPRWARRAPMATKTKKKGKKGKGKAGKAGKAGKGKKKGGKKKGKKNASPSRKKWGNAAKEWGGVSSPPKVRMSSPGRKPTKLMRALALVEAARGRARAAATAVSRSLDHEVESGKSMMSPQSAASSASRRGRRRNVYRSPVKTSPRMSARERAKVRAGLPYVGSPSSRSRSMSQSTPRRGKVSRRGRSTDSALDGAGPGRHSIPMPRSSRWETIEEDSRMRGRAVRLNHTVTKLMSKVRELDNLSRGLHRQASESSRRATQAAKRADAAARQYSVSVSRSPDKRSLGSRRTSNRSLSLPRTPGSVLSPTRPSKWMPSDDSVVVDLDGLTPRQAARLLKNLRTAAAGGDKSSIHSPEATHPRRPHFLRDKEAGPPRVDTSSMGSSATSSSNPLAARSSKIYIPLGGAHKGASTNTAVARRPSVKPPPARPLAR